MFVVDRRRDRRVAPPVPPQRKRAALFGSSERRGKAVSPGGEVHVLYEAPCPHWYDGGDDPTTRWCTAGKIVDWGEDGTWVDVEETRSTSSRRRRRSDGIGSRPDDYDRHVGRVAIERPRPTPCSRRPRCRHHDARHHAARHCAARHRAARHCGSSTSCDDHPRDSISAARGDGDGSLPRTPATTRIDPRRSPRLDRLVRRGAGAAGNRQDVHRCARRRRPGRGPRVARRGGRSVALGGGEHAGANFSRPTFRRIESPSTAP